MNNIINNNINDLLEESFNELSSKKVHLKNYKRNKRKSITIIEDLKEDIDKKKLAKEIGKKCHCRASVIKKDDIVVIQITGDMRKEIKEILVKKNFYKEEDIIIHS